MGKDKKTFMYVRTLLAGNIKAGRNSFGFTQEKLAELTGLTTQTISDIEGCRTWVSDKTLLKLSEALNVSVFQLLIPEGEDDKKAGLLTPQRISKLRKNMKDDLDKRLDMFFMQR